MSIQGQNLGIHGLFVSQNCPFQIAAFAALQTIFCDSANRQKEKTNENQSKWFSKRK